MTAVATKPRKSAPRLPSASAPAVYKRPESTYRPAIGKTAEERLATLRATLQTADEKLEAAYDAVERGTVVDTLLDLINHDLLCRAAHPVIMGVEGTRQPDSSDLDRTYLALFPVLASLEGAMALSVGSVIYSTLADACSLLNWAQNECDSAALGALLPDFDWSETFNRGRDIAINMLTEADALLDEREGMRWARGGKAQDNFFKGYLSDIIEDGSLLEGFTSIVSATLRNDQMDISELRKITLAETQAGRPGDDGTEASPENRTNGTAEAEPAPEQMQTDPSIRLDICGAYEQALAVIEMMAHEQQSSSFVFAARNLMRHDFARLLAAFDEGEDALNTASADMSVVSELLAEAAPLLTGRDGSCMWAVHAMVTLSKEVLDGYIRKVEFPGAVS